MEHSLILYVGEREAGQTLAEIVEPEGGFVYLPENLMQALGMYITYFPQVIVIDMVVPYAEEVYSHLRSVDAKPIVLLGEDRLRPASVYALPSDTTAEALLDALDRIGEPRRVPNGILRYA